MKPPPAVSPGPVGEEPADIIRSVLAHERSVQTLCARFHSVAQIDSEERNTSGALVVSKPARFRLRLFSPFGLTVFDYLQQRDGKTWVSQPMRRPAADGDASSGLFSDTGIGAAFLSRYDFSAEDCRVDVSIAACGDSKRIGGINGLFGSSCNPATVALQVGCDAIIVEQCVVGDRRYSSPTCIARSNSAKPDEFLSEHQLYAAYPPHTLSPHSGDRTRRDAELGTDVSRRNPAPRIAKMNCPNRRYVPRNRKK